MVTAEPLRIIDADNNFTKQSDLSTASVSKKWADLMLHVK